MNRLADTILFLSGCVLMSAGILGYNPHGAMTSFDLYSLGFICIVANGLINERLERKRLQLRVAELERKHGG